MLCCICCRYGFQIVVPNGEGRRNCEHSEDLLIRSVVPVQAVQPVMEPAQQQTVAVWIIQEVHRHQQLYHVYLSTLVSIQCIHQYHNQLQQWLRVIGKILGFTFFFVLNLFFFAVQWVHRAYNKETAIHTCFMIRYHWVHLMQRIQEHLVIQLLLINNRHNMVHMEVILVEMVQVSFFFFMIIFTNHTSGSREPVGSGADSWWKKNQFESQANFKLALCLSHWVLAGFSFCSRLTTTEAAVPRFP